MLTAENFSKVYSVYYALLRRSSQVAESALLVMIFTCHLRIFISIGIDLKYFGS